MAVKTDVIYTETEHGLTTGEEVYYDREVYYVRVLDANSLILYADTSLTTLITDIDAADFIIPRDRSPDIDIYPRSRYTNDGRGILGAYIFETSITTNVTNYNIATAATAAGWDGNSVLYANITVNAGVYVYATTTSTAALSTGTVPDNSKIEITNNGFIMGKGGRGASYLLPVEDGGPAMNISFPVSITNNSYIAGGGGGGQANGSGEGMEGGGGGAGGGNGGPGVDGFSGALGPSAAGGNPGLAGANGVYFSNTGVGFGFGGGGGGRILPGVGGAGGAANGDFGDGGGAGGGGASAPWPSPGGAGGSANNVGGVGQYRVGTADAGGGAGGGGGWGASGGGSINYPSILTPGGIGGKAVNLNGNAATFTVTGTVWGAVS